MKFKIINLKVQDRMNDGYVIKYDSIQLKSKIKIRDYNNKC